MPTLSGHSLNLIESYAGASASARTNLDELRRVAELDQQHARAETDWFVAVQDWMLAANACFGLQFQYNKVLKKCWYQEEIPYEAGLESKLIGAFQTLVEESDELMADLAALRARGRPVEGDENYQTYVRQARELLDDDAIRRQAELLIPSLEKLDALADAHLRSTRP